MNFRKTLIVTGVLLFMTFLAACGKSNPQDTDGPTKAEKFEGENPIATMTLDNDEEVIIELYPGVAPNTVHNFISLAEDGFYDGLIFHRVIPGFMIQGGDPEGIGLGGPGHSIKGEFSSNGFDNDLKHERGIISMARTGDPNSAGSQFFIVVEDSSSLDSEYAAFGKVITGMDAMDEIAKVERDGQDKPLEDQVIKTITIDSKGNDFPEPNKE